MKDFILNQVKIEIDTNTRYDCNVELVGREIYLGDNITVDGDLIISGYAMSCCKDSQCSTLVIGENAVIKGDLIIDSMGSIVIGNFCTVEGKLAYSWICVPF